MSNPLYYVGFLDPAYSRTFLDGSGNVINLTGATSITMFMVDRGTLSAKQSTGTWTVTDAVNGKASYQWTSRDMDTAGTWLLYVSVQLPGEPNPRELDPDTITVTFSTKGGISVSTTDVNLAQVLGNPVSSTNGVPSDVTDRQARLLGLTGMQGTPDAGTTYKTVKTASDGTLAVNSNLQAGVALGGAMMTYHEMVARALVGNVKYLTGSVALANAQSAAISFHDQNNNTYSAVTNGKTLYIAMIDATCDLGAASALQTSLMTITDATNLKYEHLASYASAARVLDVPITLASGTTLTVKGGTSSLGASFAGSLYVTLICWEE